MRRRAFIKMIGGAAVAVPTMVHAQPPMPVIGFINSTSAKDYERPLSSFIRGLGESGYTDGRNVMIEYRWADGQYDRLPAFVADMIQRKVDVIAATTTPAALAAKAAGTTIPVVFTTSSDPVQSGLVASLSRPGGNMTGVTQLNVEISPKRLELAHELVPTATVIGLLVNPKNPQAETETRDCQTAVAALGLQLNVLHASTEAEFEGVIATFRQVRNGVLVIGTDPYFSSQVDHLAALAIRNSVPAIYEYQGFVAAGGLASYGGSIIDSYGLAGGYVGRILRGEKPADLPVQEVTKVELIINLKSAKALGITVPVSLLGRADEVIE